MQSKILFALTLAVAGCGAAEEPLVTDRYAPFDQATLTAVDQKLRAYEGLREALESKNFAKIKPIYETSFQADLKALVPAHSYVSEGAGLGAALDKQVQDAIALGTGSNETSVKEAAEEQIQTIISRFTFETLYGELKKGTRTGWDTAFAYYGRTTDGKMSYSIAATAADRDTEFSTKYNDATWQAFVDGRNALVTNDTATVTAKAQIIDGAITNTYGLQAHHDFANAAEAIKAGMPADAVEPFAVGSGVVTFLRDFVKTLSGGADRVATIETELKKGDLSRPASMADVNFGLVLTTVDAAFGFKFQ